MADAAVQLKLAGQTYRVVTSAHEDELERLAARVEAALAEVTPPGRQPSTQALVLAAITLAHELENERARRRSVEKRYREVLTGLLGRVEGALDKTAAASTSDALPSSVSSGNAVPVTIGAKKRSGRSDEHSSDQS